MKTGHRFVCDDVDTQLSLRVRPSSTADGAPVVMLCMAENGFKSIMLNPQQMRRLAAQLVIVADEVDQASARKEIP